MTPPILLKQRVFRPVGRSRNAAKCKQTLKPAKNPAGPPIAPPRPRRRIQRQELLRWFDPYEPQSERRRTNYQDELQGLYDTTVYEGEENRDRRFIRWRYIRGLETDLTPRFMEKIRARVRTAFYMARVRVSAAQHRRRHGDSLLRKSRFTVDK